MNECMYECTVQLWFVMFLCHTRGPKWGCWQWNVKTGCLFLPGMYNIRQEWYNKEWEMKNVRSKNQWSHDCIYTSMATLSHPNCCTPFHEWLPVIPWDKICAPPDQHNIEKNTRHRQKWITEKVVRTNIISVLSLSYGCTWNRLITRRLTAQET